MKEQLESLNSISINFGGNGMMIVNILLAFIMFGVALGIRLDTFKQVFRHPKSIITGILLQWVGLPAVTFLICMALNHWITPMVALGMTVITPLNFFIWGTLYYNAISITGEIPRLVIPFLPMLWQILLLLGIPIVLGMLFARYFPNATKKITKPAQTLSILLFLVMVVASFSQNFQLFIDNIIFIFLIVLVHNAAAFATGYFGGMAARLPLRDRRSITIEVGIQNSGLGLVLLFNPAIFPPEIWHGHYGGMLFVTAWWGIWHIIAGLTLAAIFRRHPLPEGNVKAAA